MQQQLAIANAMFQESFSNVKAQSSYMPKSSFSVSEMDAVDLKFQRQFHKTTLCLKALNGACFRGGQCKFAHSPEDVRDRPNLDKTKLCKSSNCTNRNCKFAHSRDELVATNSFAKTKMCHFGDRCKSGDRCRYAHRPSELHQPEQPVTSAGSQAPHIRLGLSLGTNTEHISLARSLDLRDSRMSVSTQSTAPRKETIAAQTPKPVTLINLLHPEKEVHLLNSDDESQRCDDRSQFTSDKSHIDPIKEEEEDDEVFPTMITVKTPKPSLKPMALPGQISEWARRITDWARRSTEINTASWDFSKSRATGNDLEQVDSLMSRAGWITPSRGSSMYGSPLASPGMSPLAMSIPASMDFSGMLTPKFSRSYLKEIDHVVSSKTDAVPEGGATVTSASVQQRAVKTVLALDQTIFR